MRIKIYFEMEAPKWWNRLFTCRHEVVSVSTNPHTRYGSSEHYMMCLKCGRKAMDIQVNCKHEVNCFGECSLCRSRIKDPCENKPHEWCQEPETDDFYCENCGVWKDEEEMEVSDPYDDED